ncbi:hypothetical protein J6590_007448 [Homalodisca vitripennis]|nr:hypothetical protein J6590_007448 [Homalodisca vitripennis]
MNAKSHRRVTEKSRRRVLTKLMMPGGDCEMIVRCFPRSASDQVREAVLLLAGFRVCRRPRRLSKGNKMDIPVWNVVNVKRWDPRLGRRHRVHLSGQGKEEVDKEKDEKVQREEQQPSFSSVKGQIEDGTQYHQCPEFLQYLPDEVSNGLLSRVRSGVVVFKKALLIGAVIHKVGAASKGDPMDNMNERKESQESHGEIEAQSGDCEMIVRCFPRSASDQVREAVLLLAGFRVCRRPRRLSKGNKMDIPVWNVVNVKRWDPRLGRRHRVHLSGQGKEEVDKEKDEKVQREEQQPSFSSVKGQIEDGTQYHQCPEVHSFFGAKNNNNNKTMFTCGTT